MTRSFAFLLVVLAGVLAAQSFEDEFRRGLVALSSHDLPQARQLLEEASRLQPDNALVWAALAQTYLWGKEAALAHDAAGRAARLASPESPAHHALAMFYSETGDIAKAARAERLYASSKGADPGAAARAAGLSLRAGDAAEAVAWSRTALQRSETTEMHHLLGQAFAAANRPGDAERELRVAAERDPLVEVYVYDLGQMQLRRGDFASATATFGKACQRFPGSAQMQLASGVAAYGQRRFADAIDAFLRVTAIDSALEQPYVFLARILPLAGDRLPQVVAAFAAWEKAEPGNYLAVCLHAKALGAAAGDTAEIEAKLRRSIQLNDGYWEAHFELGVLLGKKREWGQAAAELSRSIELNPRVAAAHFHLARACDKLGDPERAQAERAEHKRLTAEETGAGPELPVRKDKPLP
ncbi:MAG TPA: tetratricopeptide repeat protein [Candidatus Acidoferrales bacterium]|nr:tetratricopeptide repeat protein [Candidatus Acidoferrales bacterium]